MKILCGYDAMFKCTRVATVFFDTHFTLFPVCKRHAPDYFKTVTREQYIKWFNEQNTEKLLKS